MNTIAPLFGLRHRNALKLKHVIRYLFLLSPVCYALDLYAQAPDLTFKEISIEHGLSQSIVFDIIQDSNGFMWFATEDGLNKYDGYKFNIIGHDPENPNSLSYNDIRAVCEDDSGMFWFGSFYGGLDRYDPVKDQFKHYQNDPADPASLNNDNVRIIHADKHGFLWIGTDGGLNRFDRATEKFHHYLNAPGKAKTLSHDIVRDLCEDRKGILWLATEGGLNRFDRATEEFSSYRHDPNNPHSLSSDIVTSIFADQTGTLWIGTDNGLNRLVPGEGEDAIPKFIRYQHDPRNPHSLSHNYVRTIYADRTGLLWIGTDAGLSLLAPASGTPAEAKFAIYQNDPQDHNSLSHNEVYAIYEDRSGILWLGTYGGGTNKVEKDRKKFSSYRSDPDSPNSLPNDIVWSIYEDDSGILWLGTHGGGLTRFDRKNNRFHHYQHDPTDPVSLSNNIVRLVYPDPDDPDLFWIATNGGSLNEFNRRTGEFKRYLHDPDDPESLSHDELRALYKDRSGVLWIGTNGGGLDQLVPGSNPDSEPSFQHYRNQAGNPVSLSNDFVRVVYEDPDEAGRVLWIGTQGGGLNRFDRNTQRFKHYRADVTQPNSLNNDYVFAIHEDRSGIFWIGTWGGGLNKFDRAGGTFVHYTMQNGLPDNGIYGILEDDSGKLWLSSNNGLSQFDPVTETVRNYNTEDGLQSNEFNGGSFFESRSGEMFFGGIHGFSAFFPENITDNTHIPPVVITAFRKFNKEVNLDKPVSTLTELKLSYKDYVFSFEFAALDYTNPMKNQYAYKMDGLDTDWFYTDARKRFATYTTLPAGDYTFRVKGSNNDGRWNEQGTSVQIVISPPVWQTWWFRVIVALFAVGLVGLIYRERLKNVRMKAELQAAHDAQMSIMPHTPPRLQGIDIASVCIPANEVGGDFFDYIWMNEARTKLGIAIGDVSGKAMKSAMTAVMTDGMLYLVAGEADSVREILGRVNRSIYRKTDKQMFTALCLASLDIETKELFYTNAGLNEPLLKSNGSVSFLQGIGPRWPLGLVKHADYEESRIRLLPGAVLVLFTDGIPETQNHARELYGEDRLKTLLTNMDTGNLSAQTIRELIIQDVKRFSGIAHQYDDMTVIVVKIK